MWLLVLFFIFAAAGDWLSVAWQNARERRQTTRLVFLSMSLESLSWLPLWVAWSQDNWLIAVACVLGSGLGAAIGLHRTTML